MKFSCRKDQLDKQLAHVSRVITARQSLPVLSNVLLETDDKILRISGTDLDIALTTYLPATIEQEGTFTVPAKLFQEFIHQNPDEEVHFNLESYELVCSSSKVTARLAGIDADEFPSLPKVENSKKVTLPLNDFIEAVRQVVIACAQDQARPVLTGMYVLLQDEVATLAATDSFRLVERKIPILPMQETLKFIIPARTIQELIRMAGVMTDADNLEMEVSEQQAVFHLGTIELYSRLLTGNFPPYQNIIPKNAVVVADVTTSELVQALRLSTIFSTSGVSNVLVEIGEDGSLQLSSYGSERGSVKHTIYAIVEEGFTPLRTAFNARFLLDACQAANSDHLQLRFSGATSALIIMTDDQNYLQLVMPIRLDS